MGLLFCFLQQQVHLAAQGIGQSLQGRKQVRLTAASVSAAVVGATAGWLWEQALSEVSTDAPKSNAKNLFFMVFLSSFDILSDEDIITLVNFCRKVRGLTYRGFF